MSTTAELLTEPVVGVKSVEVTSVAPEVPVIEIPKTEQLSSEEVKPKGVKRAVTALPSVDTIKEKIENLAKLRDERIAKLVEQAKAEKQSIDGKYDAMISGEKIAVNEALKAGKIEARRVYKAAVQNWNLVLKHLSVEQVVVDDEEGDEGIVLVEENDKEISK